MADEVKPAREVFIVPGEDVAVGMPSHENVAVDPEVVRVLPPLPERVAYSVDTRTLPGQYEEVFVIADRPSDATFVDRRLNDPEAYRLKRQRLEYLRSQGVVNEVLMPDTLSGIRFAIREHKWQKRRQEWERMKESLSFLPPDEAMSFTVTSLDLTHRE